MPASVSWSTVGVHPVVGSMLLTVLCGQKASVIQVCLIQFAISMSEGHQVIVASSQASLKGVG